MPETRPGAIIVLAAGEGTRMRSRLAKPLHLLAGRTLLHHAVAAARVLDPEHLLVVVGHARDQVVDELARADPLAQPVVQNPQLGTGHAAECALAAVPELDGTVVVMPGDTPLLQSSTLRTLLARHERDGNAVTLLTAVLEDPEGYGRVLRTGDGAVAEIIEHRDADARTRAVNEINTGVYAFDATVLRESLALVSTANAQGERYLTDVVAIARSAAGRVGAWVCPDPAQTEGVNDRGQLAAVGAELNRRLLGRWMRAGITVVDPATTWVDVTVTLAADCTLLPGTQLYGATHVSGDAVVGPDTTLADVHVGTGARVVRTHAVGAEIGPGANVGPFAYLRPGTRLSRDSKVGTFVETKNATLAPGAKVPHLSYVGDATVGEGSNIGAGTIFANYDGQTKNHTTVGDHCRTGSGNVFVAPVVVGDGAYTGAGAVVRRDVPPGALAVSGGPQRNIDGWVSRNRPDSAAARAAARGAPHFGPAGEANEAAPDETAAPADEATGHTGGEHTAPTEGTGP